MPFVLLCVFGAHQALGVGLMRRKCKNQLRLRGSHVLRGNYSSLRQLMMPTYHGACLCKGLIIVPILQMRKEAQKVETLARGHTARRWERDHIFLRVCTFLPPAVRASLSTSS